MRVSSQRAGAQPDARDDAKPVRGARAFGYLPNGVAFSEALSWQTKVVYAYRATFAGSFHLRERARMYGVTSICKRGLGKHAARAAIAEVRRFISEGQPKDKTCQFHPHTDIIPVPDRDYSIVQRRWFDRSLSAREAAVLIITNALMPRFGHVYVHEIAAHLPFSMPYIKRYLGALLRLGLVERVRDQGDNC
jgi:hypothetical protein